MVLTLLPEYLVITFKNVFLLNSICGVFEHQLQLALQMDLLTKSYLNTRLSRLAGSKATYKASKKSDLVLGL